MPTTVTTQVRYFRVAGFRYLRNGDVTHLLEQVADFTGADLPFGVAPAEASFKTPAAAEQPKGTIVKIEDTRTRILTLNPTS